MTQTQTHTHTHTRTHSLVLLFTTALEIYTLLVYYKLTHTHTHTKEPQTLQSHLPLNNWNSLFSTSPQRILFFCCCYFWFFVSLSLLWFLLKKKPSNWISPSLFWSISWIIKSTSSWFFFLWFFVYFFCGRENSFGILKNWKNYVSLQLGKLARLLSSYFLFRSHTHTSSFCSTKNFFCYLTCMCS